MSLAPIQPYITWGLVWDPQNKRGIPDITDETINVNHNTSK